MKVTLPVLYPTISFMYLCDAASTEDTRAQKSVLFVINQRKNHLFDLQ